MATIESVVNYLNGIIWSWGLIIVCLCLGLYFSIRLRFPQIRWFKRMIKLSFGNNTSQEGLSGFESFCLTVGGRVGVGNIAGVATAIALGGPGAVFWMMLLAFLASSSAFVEAALAQIYKERLHGEFRGGPSFYIEKGMGQKWYAVIFACAVILGLGICVPGVQTHSIIDGVRNAFGINKIVTGLAVCLLVALSVFGSAKHLGKVVTKITPVMTIGYIICSLIVIFANASKIPDVLKLIFSSAFGTNAVYGGILGSAIAWGVKRGIYSSDAGMGVGAIASGSTSAGHPAEQGLIQAFSVWVDTLVICLMTALTLLCSDAYNVINERTGDFIVKNLPDVNYGVGYAQSAIDRALPGFGSAFVAIAIFFFAFSSLIAFYHYAESNVLYLLKNKSSATMNVALWILRIIFLGSTFLGVSSSAGLLWNLADTGIGILSWLNLIAIFIMQNDAIKVINDYGRQIKMGVQPSFDPDAAGLPKASDVWRTSKTV